MHKLTRKCIFLVFNQRFMYKGLAMLIRFSAENFLSISEKQELTLVASSLKDLPDSLLKVHGSDYDLLPAAAIYGANASGKTNILRALHFIAHAVESSHRIWEPGKGTRRRPFLFSDSSNKPSSFEVEFVRTGVRYRYGFSLDSDKILEEWLYAYPNGKQQRWFTRAEIPERTFSFSRDLAGEKTRTIEGLTRSNSLYLSAAAQNNHESLMPVYDFLVKDLRFSFSREQLCRKTVGMCTEDRYKGLFLQYLKAADLGVLGFRIEEEEIGDEGKKFFTALKDALPKEQQVSFEFETKLTRPLLQHRGQGESSVELPFHSESDGTIAYFSLLGPVVDTLESGGVLCVDELNSSLHPLLALELVRVFSNRSLNKRGAQMIFNTHDTNLLDSSLLRRDQVWFTEKDSNGATHLYPLSDFKPRKNENLERGYLQGRYGAIPFLGHDLVSQDNGD
jgi:AAA15 family ATPase/GTPase